MAYLGLWFQGIRDHDEGMKVERSPWWQEWISEGLLLNHKCKAERMNQEWLSLKNLKICPTRHTSSSKFMPPKQHHQLGDSTPI